MFDSHAHINDTAFDEDRDAVISNMLNAGIAGWVEVGTSVEESKKAIELAKKYDQIYASVGVHPHELKHMKDNDWQQLDQLANNPRCRVIGEVGLDFSRIDPLSPIGVRAGQEKSLRRFIKIAQEKSLPVIFHVRSGNGIDAHDELIRILKTYPDTIRPKGVIHTFSGNLRQAQEYINLGMMISFSGVLTFKKSEELREIAKAVPLESILVETDCPYLTPEPYRGKRNDPSFCKFVIQKIAEIRKMDVSDIGEKTHNNAKKLFSI